ncbi:hypothetical protein [Undibacterium parvum]|uniref:Uncharacterized protein n=2 Tax=Undibacterium TaxID=401469 RepID=A0A6M4A132_9BURK|nr:hypothetical protein [Undibacterium parvum]AZP13550.1 hypothetical protein EJN92_17080 [Undibacterium parvum]QJQ04550.1 hypothetical protein EJG51_000350 [Undibacterium piscinae]
MEKLDKPQTKDYDPLVMWACDLEEIFSVLNNCTKIEFVADHVKFESVEEFVKASKGRNPKVVKIKTSEPYLTIDLYHRWAQLYVSSSELLASGLFHKIDSILSRCERKPKFFYRYGWVFGCSLILPNIFYLSQLKSYRYLSYWSGSLIILWLSYVAFIQLWRFSVIHPMYREARLNFFRRNKDSLVIALISAMVGAVGGVGATKIADRVWPSTSTSTSTSTSPAAEMGAPRTTTSPSPRLSP